MRPSKTSSWREWLLPAYGMTAAGALIPNAGHLETSQDRDTGSPLGLHAQLMAAAGGPRWLAREGYRALPEGNYRRVVAQVLLVEDDDVIADVVGRYLGTEGLAVRRVSDGPAALAQAFRQPPDLCVLDLMLPGLDGREVCARLRRRSAVPVIMLTALDEEQERIAGLEAGADDYVTKPFSPRELVLRVHALLRRASPSGPTWAATALHDGDLVLDLPARVARLNGEVLSLSAREFDLMTFFLRNPGTVLTRQRILEEVWGWSFGNSATITVHIRRLREKIEADPARPARLVTVWGTGYRFDTHHTPSR